VGVRLGFHRLVIVVQSVEGADRLELVVDVIDCVHGGGDNEEDGELIYESKSKKYEPGLCRVTHTPDPSRILVQPSARMIVQPLDDEVILETLFSRGLRRAVLMIFESDSLPSFLHEMKMPGWPINPCFSANWSYFTFLKTAQLACTA